MISWVKFYKYCFGLEVSASVLQEYDEFIAGRENVPFQLFIVLFYFSFIIHDLNSAFREYDHSVRVHRHAMWIRLGMFSSIAAAIWMFCVAVAMVLKRYNSKSKLFQRISPYYRSVVECGIIVTAINVCLTMIAKVQVGSCETNSEAYCNSGYQCGMLPQPLMLAVWFLSAGVQIGFRGVRLTTILINLFLSTSTYIFCIVVMGPPTMNTFKVIFLYSLFGFMLIFEFQRSSMAEFMLNRQLNDMLIENKRLDQESRTSEMRIMVFNLAHNFKKVEEPSIAHSTV